MNRFKRACFAAFFWLILLLLCPCLSLGIDQYHLEQQIKPTSDELHVTRVIERLCREAGVESPFWDPILSAAARPLALRVAKSGMKETDQVDTKEFAASIREQGGSDSAIRAQIANMFQIGDTEKILKKELIQEIVAKKYSHMGVAVESRLLPPMKYMVIILSRRPVLLEPFEKTVMPVNTYFLKGSIYKPVDGLRILLAKPSGNIEMIQPTVMPDGSFKQEIPFDEGGGKYTIELQVNGSTGPEIAALFDVHSLGDPAASAEKAPYIVIPDLPPVQSETEAEGRLAELINAARESAKKPRLLRRFELDQVARKYAGEMIAKGFVGHRSPEGEDVSDRVKKANLKYKFVGENIAVNDTVIEAHKNLMGSPAHAALVLDNRFSQLGVGVVFKVGETGRHVYVVEVFFEPY